MNEPHSEPPCIPGYYILLCSDTPHNIFVFVSIAMTSYVIVVARCPELDDALRALLCIKQVREGEGGGGGKEWLLR